MRNSQNDDLKILTAYYLFWENNFWLFFFFLFWGVSFLTHYLIKFVIRMTSFYYLGGNRLPEQGIVGTRCSRWEIYLMLRSTCWPPSASSCTTTEDKRWNDCVIDLTSDVMRRTPLIDSFNRSCSVCAAMEVCRCVETESSDSETHFLLTELSEQIIFGRRPSNLEMSKYSWTFCLQRHPVKI